MKLVKFLLVGGVNTIFGYGIYALFIFIGFHYSLASLLSTILGVLFNFKTTGLFVFQNGNNRLILRFAAVYTVIYGVNVGLLKILDSLSIDLYWAGAITVLPLALLSFLLLKKIVFKEPI